MSQWVHGSWRIQLAAFVALALSAPAAQADGNPYPRVIGATGRPYGPTQAHYQYQRQYGHAWDGSNAMYGGPEVGYVNGYPGSYGWGGHSHHFHDCYGGGPIVFGAPYGGLGYGYSWSSYNWGLGGYGGSFYSGQYPVYPPLVYPLTISTPVQEGWPPQHVWDVLHQQEQGIIANDPAAQAWTDPQPQQPLDQLRFLPPSNPEAVIESQRHQDDGDQHFQQFQMASATDAYRRAISVAPERPEPYFRLAVTLSARRKFLEAVNVLQQLLVIDPNWPAHGTPLADMFREGDLLPKSEIKQRVADWVLEDVRDADRLFLLGVFLYFDGDRENALTLLETATLIEGNAEHLVPFFGTVPAEGMVPAGIEAPGVQPPAIPEPAPLPDDAFVPKALGPVDPAEFVEPADGPRLGPGF